MFAKNKKFYITTTLPYVNADPHIGFALEIIQADVIARHYRNKGCEVFFNTGTDEHGLKILQGARKENLDPQKYCDIYAGKNRKLKEALNLSYNSFIRTTDQHHIKAAQEFWTICYKNGDIYKKNYKIKYCVGCELEKTESELVDGKCPIHPNREIEIIEEENYFFKYSKYQKKLLAFYKKNKKFVLPESRYNEIKEFTKKGLEDFSISRLKEKMPWGVPVPGDDKHVMYVWFDALVNYISCLGWPPDSGRASLALKGRAGNKFKEFWPGLQIAGKDNLRQQSSMWQAMLFSAGLPNSKQVFIHGFITANGQKMSKSLGNVIDPIKLVEKYGVDAVRYYLLREIPPFEDGDFTYEKFERRYNSDLAGGIGNLVARVVAMAKKLDCHVAATPRNDELKKEIKKTQSLIDKNLAEFRFNDALKIIWDLISWCDKYINEQKPWEVKNNSEIVISDLLFAIQKIAELIGPFLPKTSEKIENIFETTEPAVLFPRIEKRAL